MTAELRKAQARADRAEQRIRKVTDLLGLEPNESPIPAIKRLQRLAGEKQRGKPREDCPVCKGTGREFQGVRYMVPCKCRSAD